MNIVSLQLPADLLTMRMPIPATGSSEHFRGDAGKDWASRRRLRSQMEVSANSVENLQTPVNRAAAGREGVYALAIVRASPRRALQPRSR
jgi:hypothetical protein